MDTWFKWDYVCPGCDANIEMNIKSNGNPHSEVCPKCFNRMTLMSVQDATIYPTNKKEEQTMETLDIPVPTMYTEEQMNDIRKNREYWISESNRVQSQIIDLVDNFYDESVTDVEGIISLLCEIIDYQPVKEVTFTATVRVDGRIEIPAGEDVDEYLSTIEFNVDSNNYNVVIDNTYPEDVEEA